MKSWLAMLALMALVACGKKEPPPEEASDADNPATRYTDSLVDSRDKAAQNADTHSAAVKERETETPSLP